MSSTDVPLSKAVAASLYVTYTQTAKGVPLHSQWKCLRGTTNNSVCIAEKVLHIMAKRRQGTDDAIFHFCFPGGIGPKTHWNCTSLTFYYSSAKREGLRGERIGTQHIDPIRCCHSLMDNHFKVTCPVGINWQFLRGGRGVNGRM